jgi:CxxC-x17-CxxC domain-containing protein
MDFQDRPLQCLDCKNDFIFTAGEQEFYERKGFKEIPKRCKPCRDARKSRRSQPEADGYGNGYNGNGYGQYGNGNGYGGNGYGGNGYGGNGNGNGYNGNGNGNGNGYGTNGNGYHAAANGSAGPRPPRELFDATCATCGAPARVPFRPAAGRPVYCRDCYTSRQGQGSGYGGGY